MPRPTIDKDPRATAPTVHHDPVVHIGVVGVCGFNVGHSGQVSLKLLVSGESPILISDYDNREVYK